MIIKHELVKLAPTLPFKYYVHNEKQQVVIPEHWHEGIELNYLMTGKNLKFVVNGKITEYFARDIWLVNSRDVHSSLGKAGDRFEFGLIIDIDFIQKNYPEITQIEFDLHGRKRTSQELENSYYELQIGKNTSLDQEKNSASNHLRLMGSIYNILGIITQNYARPKTLPQILRNDELVNSVINIIAQDYPLHLTSEELARRCHTSLTTLNRQFNYTVQMSVGQYLKMVRLLNARKALLTTNQSMSFIAASNGFSSYKAFMRGFKQWKRITPSAYRKKFSQFHKKDPSSYQ